MKASPCYTLCASMSEEGYLGRRYTPGALKLKADNTAMVAMGDAAGFFPNSRSSTKMRLRTLNVALSDTAISELWGQAESSLLLPTSPLQAPHSTAQLNNRGGSSVLGVSSHGATCSRSWRWDLLVWDLAAPLIIIY